MHRPPPELGVTADDLAPGDARSAGFDWTGFSVHLPRSGDDPIFHAAYAHLWSEFGPKNEVETVDVLARRFPWPVSPGAADRWFMRYEFVVVCHGDSIAAIADHTAVIDRERPSDTPVCVHASHLLVMPPWRRSGLAGWMRAVPVATARRLAAAEASPARGIVLVGEVEHATVDRQDTLSRQRSFERAGFLKLDPGQVPYMQPDFRPPAEIDVSGRTMPVPLSLVVRHVGREREHIISGAMAKSMVESMYALYADGLRPSEMDQVRRTLSAYPLADAVVHLLPPTHPSGRGRIPSPGTPGEG